MYFLNVNTLKEIIQVYLNVKSIIKIIYTLYKIKKKNLQSVAQPGSVPVLGTGSRRFKSCHLEL